MNYQVNLLLPSERRSGGQISRKFIIRVTTIVMLILLALGIGAMVLGAHIKQAQLRAIKANWVVVNTTLKSIQKREQDKNQIATIADDAAGWCASRVAWNEPIAQLPAIVPATIQLTHFMLSDTLDKTPARQITMTLTGKVSGEYPEMDVKTLRDNLKNNSFFDKLLAGVEVKRYEADPAPGSELKVFTIECRFIPRPMKP